jgi:hypothetical protein
MTKSLLEKTLRKSPQARRHKGVIRDTLKALKELNAAGVVAGGGYDLQSPYGLGKKPTSGEPVRKMATGKMTYSA